MQAGAAGSGPAGLHRFTGTALVARAYPGNGDMNCGQYYDERR